MKIAVITGASSGMGKAFTRQIAKKYKELDEIWVIARKKEALEKLKKEIPKLCILSMDLTDRQALDEFCELLRHPEIGRLVKKSDNYFVIISRQIFFMASC